MISKKLYLALILVCSVSFSGAQPTNAKKSIAPKAIFSLSKEELRDKIMGGWAGQTIGVTFGGPTEFKYNGTMIQDYIPIKWYDGYIKHAMENNPGLYDDIYMDLTFVDVFEKKGLDAPVDDFAQAYARAGYMLWHANQAGRYNILHGIPAPQSGHWINNPHADCIDYQIEADFAGLMSPGMPNTASYISDKIGHIMNYGDGWYGGVYIGAMYSLAFISSDIHYVVTEALKTIPQQSKFYQVIHDVIGWHKQYPTDWKKTWFEIERKYTQDVGCPEGVFVPFNIDAPVNAAYVVLGLLYGNGDYSNTLEITTRAGQDSDCNPSSSGGILGTMLGYKKIPEHWKMGLKEAEPIDFKYTTLSLNDVYALGFKHALENIQRNGGRLDGDQVIIASQQPNAVKFEQSFEGHFPIEKREIRNVLSNEFTFDFEGIGFVVRGRAGEWNSSSPYIGKAELYLDDKLLETVELPANFTTRRYELFWKYQLTNKRHTVKVKLLNPVENSPIRIDDIIVYGNKPTLTKY